MKRIALFFGLLLLAVGSSYTLQAQSVLDAEDDNNFNNFYSRTLTGQKKAMPYAYLRENDVVWETVIWRTIDMREKFNQYLYFPNDQNKNTQGRINLCNTIMNALKDGQIEVFADDDMKIPMEYEALEPVLHKSRIIHIAEFDEYDEELEGRDSTVYEEFNPEDVLSVRIKEYWYIDKQDTRQKVRITALALVYNDCKDRDGERVCGTVDLFWVPMNDMRVRNILATNKCYDENNSNAERTYDDVFITRYFDSYIYREANRFNRTIASYLTGTDAIVESQAIEDKVFDIESDMWEY
ncbi:MAG: gliding motility protein GldN [Bacteroidales bacterium]|nr:gliding motility protein GldN [Bacteroidales bacterium]